MSRIFTPILATPRNRGWGGGPGTMWFEGENGFWMILERPEDYDTVQYFLGLDQTTGYPAWLSVPGLPIVRIAFIPSTAVLFPPSLGLGVSMPSIASTATLYPVSIESPINITGATISSGAVLHPPTIAHEQNITASTIASGATLFAPTLEVEELTNSRSLHGNFASPTALDATEVLVIPFKVALLKISGTDSTTATNAFGGGGNVYGWGLATSEANQVSVINSDDFGAGTMSCWSSDSDECIWHSIDLVTGATIGKLAVESWDYDEIDDETTITLKVTAAMAGAHRLFWLAWGGEDTEAAITFHTEPATTGNHVETVGIADADLYLYTGAHQTAAIPSASSHALAFFGACDKDGNSAVWCGGAEHGTASSDTAKYCRAGQVIAMMPGDPNTLNARASFVSRSGTNLTLNWASRASNRRYAICALKGFTNSLVTSFTVPEDATAHSLTGLSFRPTSGLFFSTLILPEQADNTPAARIDFSLGAYSNNTATRTAGDGGCWGIRSTDNAGTSNAFRGVRPVTDDVGCSGNFDVRITVDSINSDGLDFVMTEPNGSNDTFIPCVLIG